MQAILATLVILTPLILSSICGAVCSMSSDAGGAVKVRPPALVFGIVWPVLFLGLGVALLRSEHKWPLILLAGLLPLWQLLYSKNCGNNKKAAAWLLIVCVMAALIALAYAAAHHDHASVVALGALTAWLIFAEQMAVLEVQAS